MSELRGFTQRTVAAAIELIYPRRCAGCGRRGSWVCSACIAAFAPIAPPWCARCGGTGLRLPCRCDELTPTLAALRSFALDEGWLSRAIRSFKYAGESARGAHLGALLPPLLAHLPDFDAIVPVPLHRSRERQRGYNQARLLATAIGRETKHPVQDVLVRIRATPQQVGLTADARRTNLKDAFAINPGVAVTGARFLLVDDVLTTGSTLGHCADTLVSAGASWVGAVTLAREA